MYKLTAPETVLVAKRTRAKDHEAKWQWWGIQIDGESIPWADAPVEFGQDGRTLYINDIPYAKEQKFRESTADDWWIMSYVYRIQIGWQVLLYSPRNPQPSPILRHPTQDRGEAETVARHYVTQNRSAYDSQMVGQVVWQDRDSYSDPVAICDGAEYTRQDAGLALLRGELLPLTYNDEAGDAPTSPASRSQDSQETQEPTRADDTIIRDLAQVETVRPQYPPQRGTLAVAAGRFLNWDDRPFEEVEAQVKSLGWRPIGKQGTFQNPAFAQ